VNILEKAPRNEHNHRQ